MITKEQILEALKGVEDPEIHRSVVELDMVRNIVVDGDRVSLEIVLTIQGCPLKVNIEKDVEDAIKALGAKEVDITFGSMTDEERAALAKKLQGPKNTVSLTPQQGSPLLRSDSKTKFIAITSGKGGVGKSTVSVNLAVALARAGKKVGLIDADIYGFSVPDMMGIEIKPTVIDNLILPVERFGVQVMSMGFFVPDNSPVIWRGPMLGKMLKTFFDEVHWDDLDYMILDLPPGTGDMALDVHNTIPQSKEIIVTTPHATAAFVAARAGTMALKTNHEVLGVVENMSFYECSNGEKAYIFGKDGGKKLAEELDTELLLQIPLGAPLRDDEDEFAPSVYPQGSATGELYQQLAQKVIEKA
ncbi:Mrp/NBP35 family ATP-binding protein [Tepidibacillus fermentans]|uniref:Iron-sulfur cluster carrier protein n=1 Tax=Tepidibacillus fermentans TaxID=1281767 RepID=A0A4V2USI3_9BACI|nr:Mrp/NBP35 family ATP-binding protein [Tepidibacillus fermentans]TCS81512.1 ATP-binding protein involved in chromosome partitioning [Tepidibacillus fermentans]